MIIDQFIASAESKWQRMSGLVMLLPHGYEGQGPEHSSARLERFLQLCAEDNLQVVNLTTPAQYFHALRRQMHRNFRKPLIVMSPEEPAAAQARGLAARASSPTGTFQPVIDDPALGDAPEAGVTLDPARVTRLLLCSGKIYYALLAGRRERALDTAAIVRVEQLYPFPREELDRDLRRAIPNAREIVWVQEEPWNMGAWQFIEPRLRRILPGGVARSTYVGPSRGGEPGDRLVQGPSGRRGRAGRSVRSRRWDRSARRGGVIAHGVRGARFRRSVSRSPRG